jgi:hypothetical protein
LRAVQVEGVQPRIPEEELKTHWCAAQGAQGMPPSDGLSQGITGDAAALAASESRDGLPLAIEDLDDHFTLWCFQVQGHGFGVQYHQGRSETRSFRSRRAGHITVPLHSD